ncbi:hypothetical protein ABVK25_003899 [Lepraria finkii]|uniref:Uncharacterized protein n=1 Tax=Lepraria finkii TaxID=1340010 RepID=A0ABR4BCU5_9LECA
MTGDERYSKFGAPHPPRDALGNFQKDGVYHVEAFPLQLLLTKAAPHLESPSFSTAISIARSFAILLHTLLYTLRPEIMYAQSALGPVVLAGSAPAKLCMNMTVPVNISARTGAFNIAVPQTNLDATTFVQNNTQQGKNFTRGGSLGLRDDLGHIQH